MLAWIKIAFRNLVKNWRRSVITSLAIALGFTAVNIFGGFTEYMYRGNRDVAIYSTGGGHLAIFKRGFLKRGQFDPAGYLLSPEDIAAVTRICSDIEAVILVTPQLRINGLLSNGRVSTIFVAQGIVPSAKKVFLNEATRSEFKIVIEGQDLDEEKSYGVGVTYGLADLLNLEVGSSAVAFTTTVEGQMNALDVEVFFLFNTDSEDLNDKVMQVPFQLAQNLYDTAGADRLVMLLKDTRQAEPIRDELRTQFSKMGLDLEIKTWVELGHWYRKVKNMFDVIFLFLFLIVLVIVVISVVNTMSMAVIERTREIGTLRALGLKRKGVIKLFAYESLLLGLLGIMIGYLLTCVVWWAVDFFKPTWIPPNVAVRIPIQVEFVPEQMAISVGFLICLCLGASLIPARRVARKKVVDALGHV